MRVIAPGLDLVELAAVRMQAAGCVMCGITSRPPCTPVAHRGHGTPEPRDQSLYAMWRWGIPHSNVADGMPERVPPREEYGYSFSFSTDATNTSTPCDPSWLTCRQRFT